MKPILFNTNMVRAILEGRKSVTRRVIKNKDIINGWDCEEDGTPIAFIDQRTGDSYPPTYPCPYRPGDILYVRETWNSVRFGNGVKVPFRTEYWYKADDTVQNPDDKWRPSIHMPKEAARLFLRVTDVRVERLQDISSQDIEREGIDLTGLQGIGCITRGEYIYAFQQLWDSTTKPADLDRYGWVANPWVWVIEFERISKEAALKGGGC